MEGLQDINCRPANRPAFGGTVPLFYQMSRVPLNLLRSRIFLGAQFLTLPQIIQFNVIAEIPFDFSQKYQTVPRPNRRATVYFGTQLISVGCILLKNLNVGPANRPAFCRQVPLFYAKCPSKNILQVGRSETGDNSLHPTQQWMEPHNDERRHRIKGEQHHISNAESSPFWFQTKPTHVPPPRQITVALPYFVYLIKYMLF